MPATRWTKLLDDFARRAHREMRVALARPASPDKWLFVVGCYNSGTTLLAEVLGRHPQVAGLPTEGQYLTDQLLQDYTIGLPRMWVQREDLFRMDEGSGGPDVRRIRKEWSARITKHAPVMLEKTPANMARTRWLQANFSPAFFVGIIRNPYAVAAGIRRKARPEHLVDGWPIDLCAYQWARSNEILEQDSAHLAKFMWLRYEELVADTPAAIERTCRFAGIDEASMMNSSLEWKIHEREESIRDLNAESLRHLSAADIASINSRIAPWIEHFGYEVLDPARAAA